MPKTNIFSKLMPKMSDNGASSQREARSKNAAKGPERQASKQPSNDEAPKSSRAPTPQPELKVDTFEPQEPQEPQKPLSAGILAWVATDLAMRLSDQDVVNMMRSCNGLDEALRSPLGYATYNRNTYDPNFVPAPLPRQAAAVWRRRHGSTVPHEIPTLYRDWSALYLEKNLYLDSVRPRRRNGAMGPAKHDDEQMLNQAAVRHAHGNDNGRVLVALGGSLKALGTAKGRQILIESLERENRLFEATYFRDVNVQDTPEAYQHLAKAWQGGLASVFALLASKRTSLSRVNDRGDSSLHLWTRHYRLDIVTLLLQHGANPNGPNNSGDTPLHEALKSGPEFVRVMLERGADPNARNGSGLTPLHITVRGRMIKKHLQLLLDHHADATVSDPEGNTPLHMAAFCGYSDAFPLLLPHSDLTIVNDAQETVLHCAVRSYGETAEKLLQQVPRKTVQAWLAHGNNVGNTPLHAGLRSSISAELAENLLRRGADIHQLNNARENPVIAYVKRGYGLKMDVMEVLLDERWDLNLNDIDQGGNTLLHIALTNPSDDNMQELAARMLELNACPSNADILVPNAPALHDNKRADVMRPWDMFKEIKECKKVLFDAMEARWENKPAAFPQGEYDIIKRQLDSMRATVKDPDEGDNGRKVERFERLP